MTLSILEELEHLMSTNGPRPPLSSPSSSCLSPSPEVSEQCHWSFLPVHGMIGGKPPPKSRRFITSKEWILDELIAAGESFCGIPRVSASDSNLAFSIEEHERTGVPLIIEAWHTHPRWPTDLFTVQSFCANSPHEICARNVYDGSDRTLPLSKWIEKSRATSPFATPDESERLYCKDALCPPTWNDWLHSSDVLPSSLLPEGSNNMLLNVPKPERVETLMCYLGIGDTFTPCHKDICASSGQNIMCYTEDSGSSFWFMTESSAAPDVAKYLQKLGQELDHETYVLSVEELANAPFKVYIAQQTLGDMVLVPPRSCHQVINHGGMTIKTSWSRMTINGLDGALHNELHIYRRVCRPETYRVKYTIYHSLLYFVTELEGLFSPMPVDDTDQSMSEPINLECSVSMTSMPVSSSHDEPPAATQSDRTRKLHLALDLPKLLDLFDSIIVEEYCKDHHRMQCLNPGPSNDAAMDDRITCDFCGSDVFQSFFECWDCADATALDPALDAHPLRNAGQPGDGLVICPSCYVEGRSCRCELMTPLQYRPFDDLLQVRRRAVDMIHTLQEDCTLSLSHDVMDERALLSEERLGIFKAGCVFQQRRKQNSGTRSCRFRDSSHVVPYIHALRCKKCHDHKCFEHLLTSGIHSAEAILSQQKDDQHEDWHRRHSKVEIDRVKSGVLQAEQSGVRLDLRHQLSNVASRFPICNPVKFSLVKLGWYDRLRIYEPDTFLSSESPLSSLTPSPVHTGGSLPGYVLPARPSTSDDDRAAVELALQPFCTPVNSESSGNGITPEPTLTSSNYGTFRVSVSESRKRHRQREILDYVLVPAPPILKSPFSRITSFRSPKTRMLHRDQMMAASPPNSSGDFTVVESSGQPRLCVKELVYSPSILAGCKVGPPVKRPTSPSRRRIVLDASVDDTSDERPLKRIRITADKSVGSDNEHIPLTQSSSQKVKFASLPRAHKVSVGISDPSNVDPIFPSATRRAMSTGPGNVTHAINASFQANTTWTPRETEHSALGLKLSSEPSTPKITLIRKYEKKIQALEKRVQDDASKLRDLEAEMKHERLEMQQQNRTATAYHEQEMAKLQRSISEKDAQLLRYAEMNRPAPAHQIVLADHASLKHLLEAPGRNKWHTNTALYHGHGRGRGRGRDGSASNIPSGPSYRRRNQALFGNHQATGTSPQFDGNGVGEHQRFQARDNGNQGWTFSPPRNFEGRLSGKPASNGRSNRAYHQGYGRGVRNHPKPFHPGRANYQSRIRRSQATAPSWGERRKNFAMFSHEGMDAGPSSLKEPEHQPEDRLLEDTESAVPHPGDPERGRDPPSPSEPEFWEDGYENDSSNQERTFMGGVEDASNRRSIAADSEHRPAATHDRRTPFTAAMEANPWVQ